jgi:DNA-directed RNA polymerase specialized sigma subunit
VSARPGGYVTQDDKAQRLDRLRDLWPSEMTEREIGARLGVSAYHVSRLAKEAGLTPRRASA